MKKNTHKAGKIASVIAALAIMATQYSFTLCAVDSEIAVSDSNQENYHSNTESTYLDYYNNHISDDRIYERYDLQKSGSVSMPKSDLVSEIDGIPSIHINEQNNYVEYSFNINSAGMYAMTPQYYQLGYTGKDIAVSLTVDGSLPFSEAISLSLPRIWEDSSDESGNTIIKDESGDDLRPIQIEKPMWTAYSFRDVYGLYSEPYLIYLSEGQHNLRLSYVDGEFAIGGFVIGLEDEAVSYKEYIKQYDSEFTKGEYVCQQAEETAYKNSSLLYPTYDRGNAATVPNDPVYIRLNTIGQTNWQNSGEMITWLPDIKTAGLYKITIKARQSYNYGMISYRTLRVNGNIPFKEAENIEFEYSLNWKNVTLKSNDKDLYIYLEPGDEISLECVAGKTSTSVRRLQENINYLSDVYREILIITGSSPDSNRDYNLSGQIPDLEERLLKIHKNLILISNELQKIYKSSDSQISTILEVADMVYSIADRTDTIPVRLSTLQSNIESLGNLIMSLQQQPLELDYIAFSSKDVKIPSANTSFFKSLVFGIKKLLNSYITDYSGVEGTDKALNVWVSTGRDQAQILEQMISDDFIRNYKTNVTLSIVDTSTTLIKATLAGKGPDIALMIPQESVVNLAMRGALLELSDYDFSELEKETTKAAWTPLYYNGGLYALPETEVFDVLFYRTDIFEEIGLEVPQTWDDFYNAIKVLQTNSLEVGLQEVNAANAGVSAGIGIFNKLLFQSGGTYYSEDLSKALFNTETAYKAFTKWTEFYTVYGLDRDFNFFNRFRSGVMPMGITSYAQYGQLMYAAPEIRGLWSMAPVPGTLREDGSIDRTQSSGVTGCMILNQAKKRDLSDEAVNFISWWTSGDVQSRYAEEVEATMGMTARYTPANMSALKSIKWTKSEFAVIEAGRQELYNVAEIPGNYLIVRSLTSAFRDAISGVNEPWRSLMLYNNVINNEITRKREEFGLGGGNSEIK